MNFNAFLEKAKLKDDGSNYTDWVRNLSIILIAAQKNYVLEASLGARPAAGATPDVVNAWQNKVPVNLGPNVGDIATRYDPPRRGRGNPNGGLRKEAQ